MLFLNKKKSTYSHPMVKSWDYTVSQEKWVYLISVKDTERITLCEILAAVFYKGDIAKETWLSKISVT